MVYECASARVAMEAGTHSIWISEQLQELGHQVIVANVRELRAISHSDGESDQADAEKLARFARLDPKILRPIAHRTVEQQEALTLNPVTLVRQSARRQREPEVLTVGELKALFEGLEGIYRTMVFVGGVVGLRVSEVIGLRWSDGDFESGEIRFRRGIVRQH